MIKSILKKISRYGLVIAGLGWLAQPCQAQEKNLQFFLEAALESSPILKDLRYQQQSNLIDSLRIRAGYGPLVSGISNNSYAPYYKGWGYDYAVTNGANFMEVVSVSKTLVQANNLQNQFAAIRILNEALKVNGKIAEQDIRKSVTAQYITAFGSLQQYQFNKELAELLEREEVILKQLTTQAVYRQTDYLSFLVTLQQQQLLVNQLRAQFQNDFGTLNYLCGLKDTSFVTLARPVMEPELLPGLEYSAFYQQFQIDSLKLRNSDAQIDFNYKPKINLYADAGYLSSLAIDPYKNFGASMGLSLVVPIYDGHQRKMLHDKITIEEQNRRQSQAYFKAQYDQQIAQLFQQLNATEQLISQASGQIRYADALVQANRKLLATGDARIADYIIAIGNYLNARNVITQNTVNKFQIINQINYWNKK